MKKFTYRLEDENGLHARPAGVLATYAKRFDSSIRVETGEKSADAKRLLALMTLGAKHGAELTFFVEGNDEEHAAASLEEFCRKEWQARTEGKTV